MNKKQRIVIDLQNGKFGVMRVNGTEAHGNFDTYAEAEQAIRDANHADELSVSDPIHY